jgi:hypothetical protein
MSAAKRRPAVSAIAESAGEKGAAVSPHCSNRALARGASASGDRGPKHVGENALLVRDGRNEFFAARSDFNFINEDDWTSRFFSSIRGQLNGQYFATADLRYLGV